jgi:hypothetical protein
VAARNITRPRGCSRTGAEPVPPPFRPLFASPVRTRRGSDPPLALMLGLLLVPVGVLLLLRWLRRG